MRVPGWAALGEGPWRWVFAAALGAVLVLALGLGGWSWYAASQARAARELEQASALARRALAEGGDVGAYEAGIQKLEEAIARHPSSRLVPRAAYHLGNLRYRAGAWEAARRAYRLALDRGARGSLAQLCRLGLAYAWEGEGKAAEALGAYREALARLGPRDFLYEETLLGLARSAELAGQTDEAREAYRRLLRELPRSPRAEAIRGRLTALESRSP